MKKSLIFVVIVGLLAMLTVGCSPEAGQSPDQPAQEQETASLANESTSMPTPASTTPSSEGTNFRLLVSDEKNDIDHFQSLNVTISRVGVHKSGDEGGWIEPELDLTEPVDLTELQGPNATEICTGELAKGTYNKVFIYVSEVVGILVDDPEGDTKVKLPGGKLQISKQFEVTGIEDEMISFVFDITVIQAGKSGKYILKPQIAESGADVEYTEVESKGKSKDKGKPDKVKPENQEAVSSNTTGGEDTTAPVITIDGVSHGANYTGNVTPEFVVLDDTDPTPAVNATLNGLPFVSGTELSEVGEYELVVAAKDASGNEAESSVDFKIIEIGDTIAPVISVDGVIHGANYTGNITITINVTDDTDPSPAVNATLNGLPFVSGTELSEVGEYELVITAEDASGNEAEVTIEFEIKQPVD